MMKTPAMAPTAAPRARRCSLTVTSVLASSISSRTRTCARSVTSCSAAAISCGLPDGSLVAKALEDHREQQAAGERGADLDLGALERRHLVGHRRRLEARRLVGRAGVGRRVDVAAHSGGSSSKTRCQIIVAVRCTAIEASAPRPASSPDQISRLVRSLSMKRGVLSRRAVESLADGLHDVGLRLLELLGDETEDPAREHLLDGAVEGERGELGSHVGPELPARLGAGDDVRDQLVGLADLGEMGAAEGVGRARDLDDDDLHQVGVVAVGVDDEARDRLQLVARRPLTRVGLADDLEHHVPALEEQRVEHGILGREVVVDEPVGDARLVGDVRHAAGVEALAGEDAHRRVEDLAALVLRGLLARRDGHQTGTPVPSRRLARLGSSRRMRACAARSSSAVTWPTRSGAVASTRPHGSTISERPPERMPPPASPTWLAATTNAWSSIARARTRISQWSRVVASVKAAGTTMTRAPRTASSR